ncbi:MAG: hypothetical protein ACI8T1_004117, partial [Verrucomicrobiales bacterium]
VGADFPTSAKVHFSRLMIAPDELDSFHFASCYPFVGRFDLELDQHQRAVM